MQYCCPVDVHFPSSSPKEVRLNIWQHCIQLKSWVFRCHCWWGEDKMEKQRLFGETSSKALSKWVDFPSSCLSFVGLFFSSCLQLEQDIRCGASHHVKTRQQAHLEAWKVQEAWTPSVGFLGLHNKEPQTKWLKTVETYSLLWKLEVWSQDFKRPCSLQSPWGDPSLPLLVSGGPRCSLAYDSINSLWAFIFLWPSSLCLYLPCPSCKSTSHIGQGPS